jgi:hypothetical protein
MKKSILMMGALITFTIGGFTLGTPVKTNTIIYGVNSSVKILNDTDNEIKIHTGSGVVTLNANGGSTSISCNVGTKIYTAPNGSKKDLIFEIDDTMCDKTVKLSKYLD